MFDRAAWSRVLAEAPPRDERAAREFGGLLVEWIYAELFAMPLSDPALGLDVPDPFSAYATA